MIRYIVGAVLIALVCTMIISVAGCGGSDGVGDNFDDGYLEPEPYDPGDGVPDGDGTAPPPPDDGDGTTPQPPDDGTDGPLTPPPPPIV